MHRAAPELGLVAGSPLLDLGEGPVWDADRSCLWWVDSLAGTVLNGTVNDSQVQMLGTFSFDEPIGCAIPATDGGFVISGERDVIFADVAGRVQQRIRVVPDAIDSRLNDAVCDPIGRFLAGSIRLDGRSAQERLFSVDGDGRVLVVAEGFTVSNGIGFSADGSTMFFVDSKPGRVLAYDYDVATGGASHERVIWSGPDLPDGLAVDTSGNLWIAFFIAGVVRCLSPAGEILTELVSPVPNPTCPEFVGAGLDQLIVTSSRFRMTSEQLQQFPQAGGLLTADVGVAGVAAVRFASRVG